MSIRSKSRSLKKYEASSTAIGHSPGDPPVDVFSPFGPLILQTAVSSELTNRINHYANRYTRADAGSEFLVAEDTISDGGESSLQRQTEHLIRRYLELSDEPTDAKVRIDRFWIVSQYEGTPSPVHFHSGDISGVMYLKVPNLEHEDEGEQKTYVSGRQSGYINFLIGGKQRFSKSLVSFKPRVGDFYVFPGWLLHGAEPFRGTGERRSLAFNAYVDSESR